jgi:hypothetical protein
LQLAGVEIVAPAEGDDAPLAEKPLELELAERQVREGGNQPAFLLGRQNIGLVP